MKSDRDFFDRHSDFIRRAAWKGNFLAHLHWREHTYLPAEMGDLTELVSLKIDGCVISDRDFMFPPNLEIISAIYMTIDDKIPHQEWNLQNVRWADLSGSNFLIQALCDTYSTSYPQHLEKLYAKYMSQWALQSLQDIGDSGMPIVSEVRGLLDISGTKMIPGTTQLMMPHFKKADVLIMDECGITDQDNPLKENHRFLGSVLSLANNEIRNLTGETCIWEENSDIVTLCFIDDHGTSEIETWDDSRPVGLISSPYRALQRMEDAKDGKTVDSDRRYVDIRGNPIKRIEFGDFAKTVYIPI